jgi:hypothetical protein
VEDAVGAGDGRAVGVYVDVGAGTGVDSSTGVDAEVGCGYGVAVRADIDDTVRTGVQVGCGVARHAISSTPTAKRATPAGRDLVVGLFER